jgi:hypothetical protein
MHLHQGGSANITQVINVYRQIMPQFDQFISTMQPRDQEVLKAKFILQG